MSRFYIHSQLHQLPKNLLQGSIKEWDLIDMHSLIAFDCVGNYAAWNFEESAATHRGSVKACPIAVKTLHNGEIACVVDDSLCILDYTSGCSMRKLPMTGFKCVDKIKKTKQGCLMLSTHSSNSRRLFVYTGGDNWTRIVDLGNSTLVLFDFFEDSRVVKFQQSKRLNQQETFKFSVMNTADEGNEQAVDCEADLKILVMQICPISDKSYLILGNRLEGMETVCYTLQIEEDTVFLSDPISVSPNRLIQVLEIDSHHPQIYLLTQISGEVPSPNECIYGEVPSECICCIECYDVAQRQVKSKLYIPNYNSCRFIAESYLLALEHDLSKLIEGTPIRLLKLVHQNRLYVHLMRHMGIQACYGSELARKVLGILDEASLPQ